MRKSFKLRVSSFRLKRRTLFAGGIVPFVLLVFGGSLDCVGAQDVRAKAEGEGKLMMYATFTAADSKTLLDGFKQIYPKIDAAYYRSNDSALMERYVNENRALRYEFEHVACDELRSRGTNNKHRTYHEISMGDRFLDRVT